MAVYHDGWIRCCRYINDSMCWVDEKIIDYNHLLLWQSINELTWQAPLSRGVVEMDIL